MARVFAVIAACVVFSSGALAVDGLGFGKATERLHAAPENNGAIIEMRSPSYIVILPPKAKDVASAGGAVSVPWEEKTSDYISENLTVSSAGVDMQDAQEKLYDICTVCDDCCKERAV